MIGTVGSVGGGGAVDVVELPAVVVVEDVVLSVVVAPVVVPVGVVVVVVGPPAWTVIVAVMNGCRSQWNVYVPAVSNWHVPLHPGGVGE